MAVVQSRQTAEIGGGVVSRSCGEALLASYTTTEASCGCAGATTAFSTTTTEACILAAERRRPPLELEERP
jgi:hypothetical protein